MRTLRKLLFGETWFLPLGIALVVGLAALASVVTESLWRELGGPVLLAAILALLVASVARERQP